MSNILRELLRHPLIDASFNGLDLTTRATNCLEAAWISSPLELCFTTKLELLRIPRLGIKTLKKINDSLVTSKLDGVRARILENAPLCKQHKQRLNEVCHGLGSADAFRAFLQEEAGAYEERLKTMVPISFYLSEKMADLSDAFMFGEDEHTERWADLLFQPKGLSLDTGIPPMPHSLHGLDMADLQRAILADSALVERYYMRPSTQTVLEFIKEEVLKSRKPKPPAEELIDLTAPTQTSATLPSDKPAALKLTAEFVKSVLPKPMQNALTNEVLERIAQKPELIKKIQDSITGWMPSYLKNGEVDSMRPKENYNNTLSVAWLKAALPVSLQGKLKDEFMAKVCRDGALGYKIAEHVYEATVTDLGLAQYEVKLEA